MVCHELERVAVTAADKDVEAVGLSLGRERRYDVVRLVVLGCDDGDRQRGQNLLDQAHLALELVRRHRPVGLVLGVRLRAKALARDVERDRDVAGPLVAQQVDQHRREAVDRIGRLTGGGGEVLDRQREEGAVGDRVTVDQEELRALIGRRRGSHAAILGTAGDSQPARRLRRRAAARRPPRRSPSGAGPPARHCAHRGTVAASDRVRVSRARASRSGGAAPMRVRPVVPTAV